MWQDYIVALVSRSLITVVKKAAMSQRKNMLVELYRQHLTVHTRALFLAAHARTPDVIPRLAQGLDGLFVCIRKSFHHWSCLC